LAAQQRDQPFLQNEVKAPTGEHIVEKCIQTSLGGGAGPPPRVSVCRCRLSGFRRPSRYILQNDTQTIPKPHFWCPGRPIPGVTPPGPPPGCQFAGAGFPDSGGRPETYSKTIPKRYPNHIFGVPGGPSQVRPLKGMVFPAVGFIIIAGW
jgi:hypothetical protein